MKIFRSVSSALTLCAPLLAFAAPAATDLDPLFAVASNLNVFNSSTAKHATLQGVLSGSNDVAWYAFTAQAGQRLFADHDDNVNADTLSDSALSLFDGNGHLLAAGDDSEADPGSQDIGGGMTYNAFLGLYTLPNSGTYYLALTSWGNYADDQGCGPLGTLTPPGGGSLGGTVYTTGCSATFAFTNGGTSQGSFTLHVSLADALASPVPEPGSLPLAALGLGALLVRRRR